MRHVRTLRMMAHHQTVPAIACDAALHFAIIHLDGLPETWVIAPEPELTHSAEAKPTC